MEDCRCVSYKRGGRTNSGKEWLVSAMIFWYVYVLLVPYLVLNHYPGPTCLVWSPVKSSVSEENTTAPHNWPAVFWNTSKTSLCSLLGSQSIGRTWIALLYLSRTKPTTRQSLCLLLLVQQWSVRCGCFLHLFFSHWTGLFVRCWYLKL